LDELLANLQAYTDSVEIMATEVRRFRHDHLNLLMGLGDYIENNDIGNIRRYFNDYISSFKESTAAANSRLDILMRLKTPELKSILSFKFLCAQQLGIDAHIEIPEDVEMPDASCLIDLCRIAGILADNAIEACQGTPNAVLRFLALKEDGAIVFVFANTCHAAPQMSRLFEKGYTTKEGSRGDESKT
jgi:two-component system sensor histidine kinase AgrC